MIYKALNHGNTKEWVTAPGYPIVGDPEYVDNDALELDQYGDVLNPYTGGYGPVRIPEVKVYGFKNGAYYLTLAENRTALLIREHNRNKESHRLAYMGTHNGSDEGFEEYYASLPSFAQEGGEKPLDYPVMKLLERTGQWVVRPSTSTVMTGTNSLGTNVDLSSFITNRTGDIIKSNNFSLPLPQRDFTINFSNFSPAQVKLWNRTIAPKTGMFIDPKTRTATHYTVTKIR